MSSFDWGSLARVVQSQVEQQLQLFVSRIQTLEAENADLRQQLRDAQPARPRTVVPNPNHRDSTKGELHLVGATAALASSSNPSIPAPSPPTSAPPLARDNSSSDLLLVASSQTPSQQHERALSDMMDNASALVGAAAAAAEPAPPSVPPAASSARKKRAASPTPLPRADEPALPAATPAAASASRGEQAPAATSSKRARTGEAAVTPAVPSTNHLMQMETQPLPPVRATAHKPVVAPPPAVAAELRRTPSPPAPAAASVAASAVAAGAEDPFDAFGGALAPAHSRADSAVMAPPDDEQAEQQPMEGVSLQRQPTTTAAAGPSVVAPPAAAVSARTASAAAAAPAPLRTPSPTCAAPLPSPPAAVAAATTPSKPSALAVVNAAFPAAASSTGALHADMAVVHAATPSLPLLPNSQPSVSAEVRAQAEADMAAGVLLSTRSDWTGAASRMTAAIAALADPLGWSAVPLTWLKQRSTVYAKLGRTLEAFEDAQRMIRFHRGEWSGHYTLSTLLGRDKNYSAALKQCRRAWRCVPKRSTIRALQAQMRSNGPADPSAAASLTASCERLEREAESDRKKVADRLAQLEMKLHLAPSVLNDEEDLPGGVGDEPDDEEQEEERKEERKEHAPGSPAARNTTTALADEVRSPAKAPRPSSAPRSAPSSASKSHASSAAAAAVHTPLISFGTYKLSGPLALEHVSAALRAGYRRVDTAASYDNEEQVGRALVLAAAAVPRAQVYLTTKLAWGDLVSTEVAYNAGLASVRRMKLDYVDCMMLHFPARAKLPSASTLHASSRTACWRALERLQSEGHTRRIGVSNFEIRHLEGLLETAKVKPAVNQVEMHPLLYDTQRELVAYCKEKGIHIEAYMPLAGGKRDLLAHPLVLSMARSLTPTPRTAAEVLLRWSVQHGFTPVVKSCSHPHQKANLAVAADPPPFTLSDEQMRVLDELGCGKDAKRFAWDPSKFA